MARTAPVAADELAPASLRPPWGTFLPPATGRWPRFFSLEPSGRVSARGASENDELGARGGTRTTWPGNGLIEALHVQGPHPDLAESLMLFGRFVGSWDLEWTGTGVDGRPPTVTGELHFGWVLGGRAVQDIWIVPGRGKPGEGSPPLGFHGSTIRFYDPSIDAWRSSRA